MKAAQRKVADKASPYTPEFFKRVEPGAADSAREVVPVLLKLLPITSVVDVGCGTGGWLAAFSQHGVTDVLGIDGSYVDKTSLLIDPAKFREWDLTEPLRLDRRFDLVLSMEVAEHLRPGCAEGFVATLTSLGPVVLFSAAVPFQGGTGHLNELWPAYWAARFRSRGYSPVDCLRRRLWHNPRVAWWYTQNMVLYVRQEDLDQRQELSLIRSEFSGEDPLPLVHPENYVRAADPARVGDRTVLAALRSVAGRLVARARGKVARTR
jgi:SAM-dependent methyltransferase